MNVSVVGSGSLGTTVAACLADLGHEVTAVDTDEATVEALSRGETPVDEPGLGPMVTAYAGRGLTATTDHAAILETDLTMLASPTPTDEDGSPDTGALLAAAEAVGAALADADGYHLVVVKSTALPGFVESELLPTLEAASGMTEGEDFGVAVNPAFLRAGSAVDDFMEPDRIVIGTDGDDRALDRLAELYHPLVSDWDVPVVETGRQEATMIKYANSAFLAAKASLINDIGNVCKEVGVDTYAVADALGEDDRISERFLQSGVGWGGSRLPADTTALASAARDAGYEPAMLEAAIEVNDRQPQRLLSLLESHCELAGARVAVLGLASEAGSDDVRGSQAKPVIAGLRDRGASVVAYDPRAADAMAETYPDIEYADSAAAALDGADAAAFLAGWPAFADLDAEFDAMAEPVVVDGRRIVGRREGLVYEGLTW
ncbi:UDP-glucose 6-dehydrogenase AglM [Natronomonas pharaonis DSM 2160]|uniref:UDP-glucose 6-dehydrogenase n=1 Tax=Natronomonas pharaonis (strain ATCC 35678 / DSM 2160 / CIP 103997 / JCM 8858 / NBRC 14720 / NCIMB 2260 / Gabara) TaxID=348780 RepID=A0A1U7EW07_NATPD|nr:UDP-glucose/GDP-mannose dehydrogenase family protein [Natronomonas pharaonis]CAI49252.1 UDP-glucose 6-dehydrogenase AglM [Natronomonas pharaonis DSM 2160]